MMQKCFTCRNYRTRIGEQTAFEKANNIVPARYYCACDKIEVEAFSKCHNNKYNPLIKNSRL